MAVDPSTLGSVGAVAERSLLDDTAQRVDVVLSVAAPEASPADAAAAAARPPLRLLCVLDKSGSMEGEKIRELKVCARARARAASAGAPATASQRRRL